MVADWRHPGRDKLRLAQARDDSAGRAAAPPPPTPEELGARREMDDLTDADYMFRDEGE